VRHPSHPTTYLDRRARLVPGLRRSISSHPYPSPAGLGSRLVAALRALAVGETSAPLFQFSRRHFSPRGTVFNDSGQISRDHCTSAQGRLRKWAISSGRARKGVPLGLKPSHCGSVWPRLNPCPSLSVCAFPYRRPRSDGAADGNPGISLVFREMCDSTVQTPSFLLGIRDQMVDLGAILLHGTHADPGHGKQG
jgi:hypothetical protein